MTPPGGQWPAFYSFGHRFLALPPGVLVLVAVWTLVWKGLALWRSARAGQPAWFVALLVVNTVGVLEIVYLALFAPRRPGSVFAAPPPAAGEGPM